MSPADTEQKRRLVTNLPSTSYARTFFTQIWTSLCASGPIGAGQSSGYAYQTVMPGKISAILALSLEASRSSSRSVSLSLALAQTAAVVVTSSYALRKIAQIAAASVQAVDTRASFAHL